MFIYTTFAVIFYRPKVKGARVRKRLLKCLQQAMRIFWSKESPSVSDGVCPGVRKAGPRKEHEDIWFSQG